MPNSAALHFTDRKPIGEKIAGIHVAVNGITQAFLRYASQEQFHCVSPDEKHFEAFKEYAERVGRGASACEFVPETDIQRLGEIGCFLKPEPFIASFAWQRRQMDQRAYSICGVSHTMSTGNAMEAVGACVVNPLQSWDAIICPSVAIRNAIRALWAGWEDYLAERFGGAPSCPVQTPVIPLGIDAAHFARNRDPARRAEQRELLGFDDDAVVILFLGRLSYYSKVRPLPLFLAAERAAVETGKKVHLAFYGYFATPKFGEEFKAAAADLCDRASVSFVMNSDPNFPDGIWAAADIFASPSENIQESFGLTPIEAMASGLPVVITDWDGYREAITNGEEGFLVPTVSPPPGTGADQAYRYLIETDNYGEYLAGASQATAVDLDQMTKALILLVNDPDRRRTMAAAGIKRAEAVYDWRHVIPAYDELFKELAARRHAEPESASRADGVAAHPSRPDPFTMFAGFPSAALSPDDKVVLVHQSPDVLTGLIKHRMNYFTPELLAPPERLPAILHAMKTVPAISIAELSAAISDVAPPTLMRTVGWLIKLGCVRRLTD
jgi:starch synthase